MGIAVLLKLWQDRSPAQRIEETLRERVPSLNASGGTTRWYLKPEVKLPQSYFVLPQSVSWKE